jgi:hypothetical protein
MKMTNIEVVNKINQLTKIGEKKLPARIGYAISKNIGLFEGIYKPYDSERKKILDEYSEKDEEGNPIINGDNYKITDTRACSEEMQALFDTENEIDNIHMVEIGAFEYGDKYDALTPNELRILDFMIKE